MTECRGCHPERRKERSAGEMDALMKRLNRIEGQIKGIKAMLEGERYCADILIQVAAAQQGMRSFSAELLKNHMKTCVVEEIRKGNDDIIDESIETILKLCR